MTVAAKIQGDGDDAFRSQVVGASEVAALFDCHPYLTRFELYHRRKGAVASPDFGGNDRIEAGVFLEAGIFDWACARYGYQPVATPVRLDNGTGLGGHPDRLAFCPERKSVGIVEIKMVDWLVHKGWGGEPPLNYLLQAQSYAGLAKVEWCDIVYTINANALERHQEPFRPDLFVKIEARVQAFWADVRAGVEPRVDYSRDGAALIESLGLPTTEMADLRSDDDAEQIALDYLDAKARAKAADGDAEIARTKLIERIGAAGFAMLPGHKISAGMTKGSAGTLITGEMVGTTIGARKGWRRFDLKALEQ